MKKRKNEKMKEKKKHKKVGGCIINHYKENELNYQSDQISQ